VCALGKGGATKEVMNRKRVGAEKIERENYAWREKIILIFSLYLTIKIAKTTPP